MKTKLISLLVISTVYFCPVQSSARESSPGRIGEGDIRKIKAIMMKEPCADFENKLYLIDKTYALWIRKGSCSDNSYGYTLFGKGVRTLCYEKETIIGPDKKYDENLEEFFRKMIENLDNKNLGLDLQRKAVLIFSSKK